MPEIVSQSESVTVHRYTDAEARAERQKALDSMGITLEQYREMTVDACCIDCARPEWSERWERWDDVDSWDFLLGEGRGAV